MRSTRRDGIYWWCVRWERERLNVTMFCIRMRNLCVVYIVETVIFFRVFRPYLQFRCGSCVLVLAFESAVRTHWRHKDCYIIFIENEHTHCKLCSIMPTAYASIKYEHLHRHTRTHTDTQTKTPNRDRERHRVWIRGIPCTTRTFTHTIKRQPQHAQVKSICRCILQPYGMDNFLYDDNWTNHSHTHTHTHPYMYIYMAVYKSRYSLLPALCAPSIPHAFRYIFVCTHFHSSFRAISIWPCECVLAWNSCVSHVNVYLCTRFSNIQYEYIPLARFHFRVLWLCLHISERRSFLYVTFFVFIFHTFLSFLFLLVVAVGFPSGPFAYNLPTAMCHNSHTHTNTTNIHLHTSM